MNLLLLAEACNPEWTSVPLVGFNMVEALAARNDGQTTLVTHVRNRAALHASGLSRDIEVVFINNEWVAKPLYQLGRLIRGGTSLGWTTNMAVNWPAYIAFELAVASQLKERLDGGEFDLIHRVTPVSPTLPSALATKTDVPMIVGPLNGGLPWPTEYESLAKCEREWLAPVRSVYQHLPFYRRSHEALAGVIAGSQHTLASLPKSTSAARWYIPENGIDPTKFEIADGWTPPQGRFEFFSVGRLVPYKGFDLILDAIASSRRLQKCKLTIAGDGPARKSLLAQAARLGISENVQWLGWQSQSDLALRLRNAQAFVFPSLREFGGGVVLEAMASGLPSIVIDYGGPGELIDDSTGIRLPLTSRDDQVSSIATAMERLSIYRDTTAAMGRAAAAKVRAEYTWDRKADAIYRIYGEALAPTGPVPLPANKCDSAERSSRLERPRGRPLGSPPRLDQHTV